MRLKILLVDDDMTLLDLGEFMVNRLGHDCLRATSGIEAEALALLENPDVVVMDVMLPLQNGFETLRNMRQSGYAGRVVLTSTLSEAQARMVLRAGDAATGAPFVKKPFTTQGLAQVLAGAPTESGK